MADYEFLTAWLLRSPAGPVWDALWDVDTWPQWWKGVTGFTEHEPAGPDGLGRRFTLVWRSALPYDLEVETTTVAAERPFLIQGHARGELEGTGRWRLYERADETAVLYDWKVGTTKPWMNRLAPLARPAFEWNHDHVMRRGGEGLARRLGVPLLARS